MSADLFSYQQSSSPASLRSLQINPSHSKCHPSSTLISDALQRNWLRSSFLSRDEAIKHRKLILLLPVDYVLLCRTRVLTSLLSDKQKVDVFPEEIRSTENTDGSKDVIVLRPWLKSFLLLLSRLFQLVLVFDTPSSSNATSERHMNFVSRVSALLDPQGSLFQGRCLSTLSELKKCSLNKEMTILLTAQLGKQAAIHPEEEWTDEISYPIKPFFCHIVREEEHFEIGNLYLPRLRAVLEDVHRQFFAHYDVTQEFPNLRVLLMKSPLDGDLAFPKPTEKKLSLACSSGYSTDNDGDIETALAFSATKGDTASTPMARWVTCSLIESNDQQSTTNSSCEMTHEMHSSCAASPANRADSLPSLSQPEDMMLDCLKEFECILREQELIRQSWPRSRKSFDAGETSASSTPVSRKLSRWNYLVSRKDYLLRRLLSSTQYQKHLPVEIMNANNAQLEQSSSSPADPDSGNKAVRETNMESSYEIITEDELHELWLLKTMDLYPRNRRCRDWFDWIR